MRKSGLVNGDRHARAPEGSASSVAAAPAALPPPPAPKKGFGLALILSALPVIVPTLPWIAQWTNPQAVSWDLGWPGILGICAAFAGLGSAYLWVRSASQPEDGAALNAAAGGLSGAGVVFGAGTVTIPSHVSPFAAVAAAWLPPATYGLGWLITAVVFLTIVRLAWASRRANRPG